MSYQRREMTINQSEQQAIAPFAGSLAKVVAEHPILIQDSEGRPASEQDLGALFDALLQVWARNEAERLSASERQDPAVG